VSTAAGPTATGAPPAGHPASWAGVVALGLGIFAIVMSEFLPASLLPRIAADLDVPTGHAGQAVSVTAAAAALSALTIATVLPRADRRRVMIGLTLLAAVSDLVVVVAPNLPVLLAARVLLGVALGGFWAMAAAVASRLVPADRVGRALTGVNSGVSLATVAAVPLGTWLGEAWGWRGVFLLGAAAAVLALVVQAVTLPRIPPGSVTGVGALGAVARRPLVLGGLLAVLLVFTGHFGGFTYVRPAAQDLSGADPAVIGVVLLVLGAASVVGTAVSGPLADRAPRLGLLLFPAALGAGMLAVLTTGPSVPGLIASAALWGLGFGGVPTAVLAWGARTEPARLEQVGGLLVTVSNLGIALGAVVGGVLVDTVAVTAPMLVGGLAAVGGGVVLASLPRSR